MSVKRRKRGRRIDRDGRSKGDAPFVMMEHWIFDSPAYRALKPAPRALLFELIRRYRGTNNGRIGLGVREAAKAIGLRDDEAAVRHFRTLEAAGFIVCTKAAGFNMKSPLDRTAREWRLTWHDCEGQPATKEFMRMAANQRPGKAGPTSPEKPDGPPRPKPRKGLTSTGKPVLSVVGGASLSPDNRSTCRYTMEGGLRDAR